MPPMPLHRHPTLTLPMLGATKIPHALAAATIAYAAVPAVFVFLNESHLIARSGYIFAAQFAFAVSWVGFILLLIAFFGLTRVNQNGALQTTLAGALLGPIAFSLFELLANGRYSSWLDDGFLFTMTTLGALHAAAFWIALRTLLWLHTRIAATCQNRRTE